MKRAVIVHGMAPEAYYKDPTRRNMSNLHWLPWLQQQLCARDVLAQTPELPQPYDPDYSVWEREFGHLVVDEETVLIGHSFGGGFLIRWLSEHPERTVQKLIVVAPWLDPEKTHGDLFDFAISAGLEKQTRQGIHLLHSTNDAEPMQATLARIQTAPIEVGYYAFNDYGHFRFTDMKTEEFPELLEICLGT